MAVFPLLRIGLLAIHRLWGIQPGGPGELRQPDETLSIICVLVLSTYTSFRDFLCEIRMSLDAEGKRKLACCLIQLQDQVHELRQGLELVSELAMELLNEQEEANPTTASSP